MENRLQATLKVHRFSYSGSPNLQKSRSWKQNGPQLRCNCGPFAIPFGPVEAHFYPQHGVSKIQTTDYQHFGNIAKIRLFAPSGLSAKNIASRKPENEQIV